MDWTDPTVSESTKEMEAEVSRLAARFAVWIRKRAANSQGEATPDSEGPEEKCFKQPGPPEKVQIIPTVISMNSPKQALSALPALKGDT